MTETYALVVTTINHPTACMRDFAAGVSRLDASFVIVGDTKSPPDFSLPGTDYYGVDRQKTLDFRLAKLAPWRHYARKNAGYLAAAAAGATVIVESDDDNYPREDFWAPRSRTVEARAVDTDGWVNIYALYGGKGVWPRGLPLDEITKPQPNVPAALSSFECPIQQGLADVDPDVDAIYRLIGGPPVTFDAAAPIALSEGAWCPFNSQNTTTWKDVFPLLYLPAHCSIRMTDIWRGFVSQRILWANGWRMLFHKATVWQERNVHNLQRDFEDEIPGYVNNRKIAAALAALPLEKGVDAIPENLRLCYRKLVEMGHCGEAELPLLDAFLADLADIG